VDGSVYPQKGRLNFAATAIDPSLGTQQLRAEFDNPRELLLPGQFVRVRITAGQRDNVFLVPQAAVVQTEKTQSRVRGRTDGKAQPRPSCRANGSGANGRSCRGSTQATR
jgi:membrane fusion protein (multidrug efflux system)